MHRETWEAFCDELDKLAGLPIEPDERPKVPGLKVPRVATPRLNPEVGSKIPSNPFRGNWQKLSTAQLSDRELELLTHLGVGAAAIGTGAYAAKRTADQLVSPHPAGVGAGAGARTVQRVLFPGTVGG